MKRWQRYALGVAVGLAAGNSSLGAAGACAETCDERGARAASAVAERRKVRRFMGGKNSDQIKHGVYGRTQIRLCTNYTD